MLEKHEDRAHDGKGDSLHHEAVPPVKALVYKDRGDGESRHCAEDSGCLEIREPGCTPALWGELVDPYRAVDNEVRL